MKIISDFVHVASIICALCAFVVSSEDLMLPLERTTIDDCDIRYFRKIQSSSVKPIGVPAYPGEFAHIVAIGWTQPDGTIFWNCGGSLIWENAILTAAHCTSDPNTGLKPDIIRIGDLNIYDVSDDRFVQERKIVNITRHPLYNPASVYNDLALLKLDDKVNPNFGSVPTCLWLNDSIPFSVLQTAGWGATGFGKEKTNVLVKAELKLMANAECAKYYNSRFNFRLRNGLTDHQLCAWDEVQDTCPGDSGGPLHRKLLYGKKLIPFLVGVTSFGKACGFSQPGVYVKVSKFIDWIIKTVQDYGNPVTASMFGPLICAHRYRSLRENDHDQKFEPRQKSIAQLLWPRKPSPTRCAGTLIEPDGVVTLAQCVSFNGMSPTHVKLFDSEIIEIERIVVHPNYTKNGNQLYNNIAILKLKTFSTFHPHCVDEADPSEPLDVPVFISFINKKDTIYNSSFSFSAKQYENKSCSAISLCSSLTHEHFCFGHDEFHVPGACDLVLGGPISIAPKLIHGINLYGRDCGFGEPAVGLRLQYFKPWIESVFLPAKGKPKVVNSSKKQPTDVEKEFNECESRYTHFRKVRQSKFDADRSLQYSHTATIAPLMEPDDGVHFECEGYIISKRGVVTAASCLGMQPVDFQVRIGGQRWTDNLNYGKLHLIEKVTIHPMYNEVTGENDIAVVKLLEPIQPTVYQFPVCLWQNKTHVPVKQLILNKLSVKQQLLKKESGEFENIHPLYKKDCEKRLHRSMTLPGIGCMNVAYQDCTFTSFMGLVFEHVFKDCLKINQKSYEDSNAYHCYKAGNPIVWRKQGETNQTGLTEYLVGIYSHGDCHADVSLRVVHHVAFYIEWFAAVLQ